MESDCLKDSVFIEIVNNWLSLFPFLHLAAGSVCERPSQSVYMV